MRKITLLLALFMLAITGSYAQSASTYAFSSSSGTFTENSGAATTIAGVRADTFISTVQNIGFTFVYEGVNYTQFRMSSNGFISLNASAGSLTTNDFSTANATSRPIIAPLWDDLDGATPTTSLASYEVTGSAPNRVLTVEWKNWEWNWNSGATPVISFQAKLYETTNVIEFVYRQENGAVNSGSASIGIGSATGSGSGSYLNLTSVAAPAVSSTVSTTNIATKPATGQVYRFTPPVPCTGTPLAGSVTPAVQNICNGSTPANLVATGYSSGVAGLTFQWEESNDNGVGDAWANAVGGSGATTATYTPPAFSGTTIYYRLKVTCTNSAESAQTASVVVNPPAAPVTQATNMAIGVAGATLTTIPLSWVNGSGTRRVVYFNSVNSFADPVNGNGPALTAATVYAGGQQIVYDGTGTAVTVTGLTAGTTYYTKVYEYIRCGSGPYDFYYNVSVGTNLATVSTLAPPANDNFANASAITCGNTYTGNTSAATLDEDSAPDGFGADMDAPNVWYSYTGSGTPQTVTLNLCGSSYDTSVLVYTGTSGSLTLVAGNDDDATCGASPLDTRSRISFTSNGTATYYIAVEGYNSGSVGAYTMTVSCVTACTPAVANQTCATALAVPTLNGTNINSDNSCGDISPVQPSCDTFGTIQDVWFSFVGPANGIVDCVVTPVTMTSANFSVYTGADCNSLTAVTGTCNANLTVATTEAMTGLIPGQTYYVQVWSSTAEQGTFTISLLSPACVNPSGITPANLTSSAVDLSWTATSGNYEYVLNTVATDPAGSGTTLEGEFYAASGLNPSTQYYFHLRTDCGGGLYSNWVTYSFTTLATPPANDDCTGAIALTTGGVFGDYDVIGTTVAATTVTGLTYGCQTSRANDVWYSVVVPPSGTITIETQADGSSPLTDTVLSVFSGTCGALTEVGCSDDEGTGNFSMLNLTGQTPGDTLYIGVWRWSSATNGTFTLSAYDASLGNDSFDLNGFKAYPNPVKDIFRVSYVKEISSISVHNLLGQEVLSQKVNALASEINLASLSRGTYLVKVNVDGLTNTIKVIKE